MTSSQSRGGNRGSVTIEFALATPLLVSLFLGTISFGYAFQVYGRLEETVRAGARYASILTYDVNAGDPAIPGCSGSLTTCQFAVTGGSSSAFLQAVRNMTVYGTPTPEGGQQPIVEGMSVDNVVVELGVRGKISGTTSVSVPTSVSVAISNFSLSMPVGSITLTSKPRTGFPFVGTYAPIKTN